LEINNKEKSLSGKTTNQAIKNKKLNTSLKGYSSSIVEKILSIPD